MTFISGLGLWCRFDSMYCLINRLREEEVSASDDVIWVTREPLSASLCKATLFLSLPPVIDLH